MLAITRIVVVYIGSYWLIYEIEKSTFHYFHEIAWPMFRCGFATLSIQKDHSFLHQIHVVQAKKIRPQFGHKLGKSTLVKNLFALRYINHDRKHRNGRSCIVKYTFQGLSSEITVG